MRATIVDWLGRGGIAETSEAWALELRTTGTEVEVVTRPGRDLSARVAGVLEAPRRRGRLTAHRAVATEAARRIRAVEPDVVVVQNYVAPVLERPVFAAARAVGAKLVVVVHNHQVHTVRAGTRVGLREELRRADVVVTHTRFVADGVRAFTDRADVVVFPLPVPIGMLRSQREQRADRRDDRLVAAAFGVLKRGYKGMSTFEHLAAPGIDGWEFVAIGSGARENTPGVRAVPGYVPAGELVSEVAASDVTVAPYVRATQSAVVVLSHALGSVPIASAVGGIPEQIADGVDGVLLAPDAPIDAWRDALFRIADDGFRKELAANGEARAWSDHDAFVRGVHGVVR